MLRVHTWWQTEEAFAGGMHAVALQAQAAHLVPAGQLGAVGLQREVGLSIGAAELDRRHVVRPKKGGRCPRDDRKSGGQVRAQ